MGFASTKEVYDDMYQKLKSGDITGYRSMASKLVSLDVKASTIESAIRSRANEEGFTVEDLDSETAGAGLKPKYEVEDDGEAKYSINDLSPTQYTRYSKDYGDMVEQIMDEFQRHGFGSLDKETANSLLSAAYEYASETALESASGGTYDSETKWINLAQDADDLGLTAAEYIMLKQKYGARAIASDDAYEAYNVGMDVDTFLLAKEGMDDIAADKDEEGNSISGSRKENIIDYLNTLGLTEEEYLFLLGTEYDSVKKRDDYISYFGVR